MMLPDSERVDLSARLRELLPNHQGVHDARSCHALARRMSLDPSVIYLWRNGKRLVPAGHVPALAEALGVPVEDLLPSRSADDETVTLLEEALLERKRHFRVVCLLCGADRWLYVRPCDIRGCGACSRCYGWCFVEEDCGARSVTELVEAEATPRPMGLLWTDVA